MLKTSRLKNLSHAALSLVLAGLLSAEAARAAKPFDGEWSVRIDPAGGMCRAYTVPIQVAEGRVSYAGFFNAEASGAIRQNGVLRVSFQHEDNVVNASGSLKGAGGSGQWTSPTKGCSGRWTARKS